MQRSVDLSTPRRGPAVEGTQINRFAGQSGFGQQRDREVVLGVAAQMLDNALRLGIGTVAEIGVETVMGREPHVIRCRDNDISDHTAFETAHPVSQDLGRNPADRLKGLGNHRQRGRGLLISGKAHEPPPRIRQHRAEHHQARCGFGPVHHQIVTW